MSLLEPNDTTHGEVDRTSARVWSCPKAVEPVVEDGQPVVSIRVALSTTASTTVVALDAPMLGTAEAMSALATQSSATSHDRRGATDVCWYPESIRR
jgi:hypothetical protein